MDRQTAGCGVGRRQRPIRLALFAAQKIDLDGRKSWCVSDDPEFVAKSAEIVGLYLDPPEGALVLSVNESRTSRRWNARRAI